MKNIQDFMRYLLDNELLQFDLLLPNKFVSYLKERGISISLEELEYYDKLGILRPILRLRRQEKNDKTSPNKFVMIMTDSFSIKRYYDGKMVEFPQEGDFKRWNEYKWRHENYIELFYHPYQILTVPKVMDILRFTILPSYLESLDQERLAKKKKFIDDRIHYFKQNIIEHETKIGLLMLLQGPYASKFIFDFYTDKDNRQVYAR